MADTRKTLEALLDHVAETLTEQVKETDAESGKRTCGAATLAAAIKLLKDNGIEARITKGSPLGALKDALPDFKDDDLVDNLQH